MDPEELGFPPDSMADVDVDGNGGFDSSDLPLPMDGTFQDDPIFSSGYGNDFGSSPFHTGITPSAWSSMLDTPGKYAAAAAAASSRNDSSVTAIMTGPEVKPRSHQSSTSPDSSNQESPASSQSSNRRKRKSPTSQDTNNTKLTSPSHRDGPPSLSPTYEPKKQAALGGGGGGGAAAAGKHALHAGQASMAAAPTPEMMFHEQNVDNISSAMNHSNLFDFDSAASSPGAFGNAVNPGAFDALNTTPRTLGVMQDTPRMATAETSSAKPAKFFFSSRENSPLDAMATSQHASPAAMFNTESPRGMAALASDGTFWPAQARAPQFDFGTASFLTPSPVADPVGSPLATMNPSSLSQLPCQLNIKPFNNKSRVETQIPVVLTMSPMPRGAARVHLQSHTISKPKLLAKETPKTPDTLELHATVVCTSAMQKPHLKDRALKRAAGAVDTPVKRETRRSSTGDIEEENNDPNDPLNGGEVKICSNCVNRERKRAARKKAKKQEDEEHWSQFENERIVVFNTSEYKDWQPAAKEPGYGDISQFPEGSMQVEVPMRIACYCRHQGEKTGFQVIFTIKDCRDRVLAQNISDSILITDDHKTQPPVGSSNGLSAGDFNFSAAVPTYSPELQSASFQHRPYHSTNDLQALRLQMPNAFQGMSGSQNDPNLLLQQTASASVTPRNLSRPASPTFQGGSSKRRKGSSVHVQIPANLRMTQRVSGGPNTSMPGSMTGMGVGSMSAGPVMGSGDANFGIGLNPQYSSNPSTPNSNAGFVQNINRSTSHENVSAFQFYSTPHSQNPSRGPSRVPSPVMSRPNSNRTVPTQFSNQVQNELGGQALGNMSFGTDTPQPQKPTIVRLNPTEGPITGNIQVDVHGTGFRPNLVVCFGDKPAMTTYWNEGALVAMLPPGAVPGPVEVTLQDPNENHNYFQTQTRRHPLYFKYIDDQEQAIWELFGKAMYEKTFGHPDVNRAREMLSGANGASFGYPNGGGMQMNFGQMQQMQHGQSSSRKLASTVGDTEEALLGLLSVIDLDDSPYAPNYDVRYKKTGTSMLALASGIGYTKLVAGLIARGATLDSRDRCGFTPLMLAAMRGHRQIVRLLARRGADPTVRNKLGFTAADLVRGADVATELQQTHQHVRVRSVGTTPLFHSRANSIAFAETRFAPPSGPRSSEVSLVTMSASDSEAVDDEVDDDNDLLVRPNKGWRTASRRSSMAQQASRRSSRRPSANNAAAVAVADDMQRLSSLAPMAAMAAWRDQIVAQIAHFQQSVGDMQFLAMPRAMPDYRAVRRLSSMLVVPTAAVVRDSIFFSSAGAGAPPPPYEEKDPAAAAAGIADEKTAVATALAEAALDETCERRFGGASAPAATAAATASTTLLTPTAHDDEETDAKNAYRDIEVRIGGRNGVTREQQAQLRLAHAARLRRGRSDWKVWVFWLPLLVALVVLTAANLRPEMAGAARRVGALGGSLLGSARRALTATAAAA